MTNHLYDALFAPHAGSDRTFLILPDGPSVSFGAFVAEAARAAHALRSSGLQPGDRVALQLEKSAHMLAVIAGAIQAGIVFLPLNPAYTPAEVGYFVGDAGARLLLADQALAPGLAPVAAAAGAELQVLNADGSGGFGALMRDQAGVFPTGARGPDDLAALLYTSGTTGRSKGAMMSHANLLSNAEMLVREWHFTERDVLLHALPVFHTHGLFVATNVALLAGAAMVFLPKFEARAVIRHLPQATAMMGVPTFYTRLLAEPALDRSLTAHVRLFISGSAPLLAETHRDWQARTGHMILERYGMTETNMNTSNPYEGERRPRPRGRPRPGGEGRVCDPDGTQRPRGAVGVIEVRGPNVFQGYWRMPEKTRAERRADGFFITGDLGVMAADGYVTIVGRAKDLVISGGFNIYPKEVEEAIDALPSVLESAVIGAPHPDLGEGLVAIIVPRAGAAPDAGAILAALAPVLARFKLPRHIVISADLPRNAMGKVQKAQLRALYRGVFA